MLKLLWFEILEERDALEYVSVVKGMLDRDISVGTATHYGLDGPEIESRWKQDFPHPSRLALGPTQLPIQWVPGIVQRPVALTTHPI